jgi:hypothetical protein
MIYFIKAGDFVKVGYTKSESSFKTRLDSYNTSCPFDVEVINLIEGGTDLEKDIINYFIKHHQKGEWFKYDIEIENFAKNPYILPKGLIKKPTNKSHKTIIENLNSIIEDYKKGNSLKIIAEKFSVNRARLVKYIPEELRRKKNGWFSLRKRETNPKNKKVLCITTGKEFNSVKETSRELNIASICISRVCRGERKTAKGLKFKFI